MDPHVLRREAREILDALGADFMEGKQKDAIRLLTAVIDNQTVASLIVHVVDLIDNPNPDPKTLSASDSG
jgi:hypothetical protein